jgi:hypothetical protein
MTGRLSADTASWTKKGVSLSNGEYKEKTTFSESSLLRPLGLWQQDHWVRFGNERASRHGKESEDRARVLSVPGFFICSFPLRERKKRGYGKKTD